MKVLHSIDILKIEETLLDHILHRPRGGLLDPVLVIVPTRRLARFLQRRIADRAGAALGVHVHTHRTLALGALGRALLAAPRVVPDAVLDHALEAIALDEPGPDGEHLRAYPGARRALRGTIQDLREALVAPGDLRGMPGVPAFLPRIYARFVRTVEGTEGLTDSTGLILKALPHVRDFIHGRGIRIALHHGAYELTGIHLDLVEAVAGAVETLFLLPADIDGPAFAYAARFARVLRGRGAALEPAGMPAAGARAVWIERVRSVHDAASPPRAAYGGPPVLEIQNAQGARAELRAAALRALAIHAEGVPMEEIAVVARSLAPYSPYLEETLDALGIPFTSSASRPISRQGPAAAFLALVRVLAEDLPRGGVIDLLRRPFLSLLPEGAVLDTDRWDRWSRAARIVSGLDSWRELPRIVEEIDRPIGSEEVEDEATRTMRRASVGALMSIVDALAEERRRWAEVRSYPEHARFLRDLVSRRVPTDRVEEEGRGSIEGLMDAVDGAGKLARAAGRRAPPSMEDIAGLVLACAEEGMSVRGEDLGGIRILDSMQARGLHHSATIWIGFQDGSFPRRATQDSVLPDEAREAIARSTGKLLTAKASGAEEERLLLAMGLASARDRLVLSSQRADEGGRRVARSSAVREVARAFAGKASGRLLLGDASRFPSDRIPSHPGEIALHVAGSPRLGLVPPMDAVVSATVRASRPTAAARELLVRLGMVDGARERSLACVEALESFGPKPTPFDGITGTGISKGARLSPTAVERLGRCPLAYFLRHVLGLRELDGEAVAHRVEVHALGSAAHGTLRVVYGTLQSEGLLRGGRHSLTRALQLLDCAWRDELARTAGPSSGRLPSLFAILGEAWRRALESFLRRDLEDLVLDGVSGIEVETPLEAKLPHTDVVLAGRLDRLVRLQGEGVRVDDYKTSGSPERRVDKGRILRGLELQVAIYREMAIVALGLDPSSVGARVLGVGPDMGEDVSDLDLDDELREGFLETVSVLFALARRGLFPLFPDADDAGYCSWCGYRKTCRRKHEPTLTRLEPHPAVADLRDLRSKSPRAGVYQLSGVRARKGGDDGGAA